jgi:hypothetical protein
VIDVSGGVRVAQVFRCWAAGDHIRRGGRLTEAWATTIKEDPELASAVMVVDLRFGGIAGKRVRVATVPIRSSVTATGVRHDAVAGLVEEPTVSDHLEVGQATSAARSVSVAVDARLVAPQGLIEAGLTLGGIAEIALERAGVENDYPQRHVLLRGDISSARYGGITDAAGREIVEVEITDPKETVASRLPPWVIDSDRFSGVHDSAVGERIPVVINGYDAIPAARTTSTVTGSNTFVYAQGAGFTVSEVRVNGVVYASGHATYGWTSGSTQDSLLTTYSYVQFTVGGTTWADSDIVHISAVHEDSLDVVSAVRRICEAYSPLGPGGVNGALFAEASSRLARSISNPEVLVNGSGGGSAASCFEYIEGGLLKSYPMISMVWDRGTYGPVVVDRRLPRRATWRVGTFPIMARATAVEEEPKANRFNDFLYRYNYDTLTQRFRGVATRNYRNSAVCSLGRERDDDRPHEEIESVCVTDVSTVSYSLDWLVDHQCQPSYYVEYDAMSRVYLEFRRGDNVGITDAAQGFADEDATIERLEYGRGRCTVGLRVWKRRVQLGGPAVSHPTR